MVLAQMAKVLELVAEKEIAEAIVFDNKLDLVVTVFVQVAVKKLLTRQDNLATNKNAPNVEPQWCAKLK
jgi:hypothetical protein